MLNRKAISFHKDFQYNRKNMPKHCNIPMKWTMYTFVSHCLLIQRYYLCRNTNFIDQHKIVEFILWSTIVSSVDAKKIGVF